MSNVIKATEIVTKGGWCSEQGEYVVASRLTNSRVWVHSTLRLMPTAKHSGVALGVVHLKSEPADHAYSDWQIAELRRHNKKTIRMSMKRLMLELDREFS